MKRFASLLAAAALAVATPASAENVRWVVTADGWGIEENQRCAAPGVHNVVCQAFRAGTVIPDINLTGLTADEILQLHPGIVQFMDSDGTFKLNVVVEIIG